MHPLLYPRFTILFLCCVCLNGSVTLGAPVANVLLAWKPTPGVLPADLTMDPGSKVTVVSYTPPSGITRVGFRSELDPVYSTETGAIIRRSEFEWKRPLTPTTSRLYSHLTNGELWVGFRMWVETADRLNGDMNTSFFQVGPITRTEPPADGNGYYQLMLNSSNASAPLLWRLREFGKYQRIINPVDVEGGFTTVLRSNALPAGAPRDAFSPSAGQPASEDTWVVQVRMRADPTGVIRMWRNGEKVVDSLADGRPMPAVADRHNAFSNDSTRVKWGPYNLESRKVAYYADIRIAEGGGDDGYRMVAPPDLELDNFSTGNSVLFHNRALPVLPVGAVSARVTGLPAGWVYHPGTPGTIQGTTSALTAGARIQIEFLSDAGQPVQRFVWALAGDAKAPTADLDNDGTPNGQENNPAVPNPPEASNAEVSSGHGDTWDIDLSDYVTDLTTTDDQLLFQVSDPWQGTVELLPDGHTARFTPTLNSTGVPSFNFSATDAGADADTVLAWDFDLPGTSTGTLVPDVSGQGRDGTRVSAAGGTSSFSTDQPAVLTQGARSLALVENVTTAASVQRTLTATELNWNTAVNWTVAGWFNRRDTANDDIVWHIGDGDGFGAQDEFYLNCPANATTVRLQHYSPAAGTYDVDIIKTGISPGVWHHFAIVRSGPTISLYVNGEVAGTDNVFNLAINQASPLVFGGHASTTGALQRWFDGGLDDLLVSRAALSPAQIASLANGLSVRHFGGLTSTATISLSAALNSYQWTNASTAAALPWSTATHWQGNRVPTSSRGVSVEFFTDQTLAGAITSNNDRGALTLNSLSLAGEKTTSAPAAVTISGGSFTFLDNGAQPPTINLLSDSLTYSVQSPITLRTDTTFNAGKNGTFIFSGVIDGPGDLQLLGTSGNLILAGNNTYTGATYINDGSTLHIGNDGPAGTLGRGEVINHGQLSFERTGTYVVDNLIRGDGSLYLHSPATNPATITLTNNNTFTGDVIIDSGILKIQHSAALSPNKTIELSGNQAQLLLDTAGRPPLTLPGTIRFMTSNDDIGAIFNQAGNNTLQGRLTLTSGGGATRIYAQGDTLTLTGPVSTDTSNRSLKLMGAAEGVITGVISDGGGNRVLKLEKFDAGTWTLSGANNYTGETILRAGTLKLGHARALGHGGFTWGDAEGGTVLIAGASLDLNGQQGVIESFTLSGTGANGQGALINSHPTTPASIAGGRVSALLVSTGGTHVSVPTVTISVGAGAGVTRATAVARLGLTGASITAISPGSARYASTGAPKVTISGGGAPATTTATATAVLNPTTGAVTGITITYPGAGYTSAPSLTLSGGTPRSSAEFPVGTTFPTATVNAANFTVVALQVSNPGSGYTSVPTVTFNSGSGTAATAVLSSLQLTGNTTSIGGPGNLEIFPAITRDTASFARNLTKVGVGKVTLRGATACTTLTLAEGRLELFNSLTGNVTVNTASTFAQYGPVNGNVNVTGGTFLQSDSVTGNVTVATGGNHQLEGAMNITGNYSLAAGATLRVVLNGTTPGTQHDQLTVGGTVTLGGALEVLTGTSLVQGSTFTLLNKTSTTPTTTTFAGQAENSTFVTSTGYTFRINYNSGPAGTGNDIVLTLQTLPTALEQWRATHFGSSLNTGLGSDTADPDGDRLNNLLEYAVGGNPRVADAQKVTTTRIGNGPLQITFLRARPELTYFVEATNSLNTPITWTPLETNPGPVSTIVPVTVFDTLLNPTSRYLRLRVTRP